MIKKHYHFLNISWIMPWLILGVLILLLSLVMLIFSSFLISFFLAIILYLLFRRLNKWFYRIFRQKQTPAAALTTIIVSISIIFPLLYFFLTLADQGYDAIQNATAYISSGKLSAAIESNSFILRFLSLEDIQKLEHDAIIQLKEAGLFTLQRSGHFLSESLKILSNIFFAIFIVFFLFRNDRDLGPIIYRHLPFPDELEERIGTKIVSILDAVVRGNLVVAVIQGILMSLFLWLFGIPDPLFYGTIAAFFSLVPIVATSVVWIPASIYLYSNGEYTSAIALAVLSYGAYFVLENFVKTIILDKELGIHPLFLFLAIIGGISTFGIKGIILGPFFVTLFVTVWELVYLWNLHYGDYSQKTTPETEESGEPE